MREVACVGAPRTMLVADCGNRALASVAIAAGIHGDEPAGPWALLSLVEDGLLDSRFSYRLWPCTNPSGMRAHTRENAEGVDVNRTFGRGGQSPESRAILTANRDRKFALSIDLHEDCTADGFYCFEYNGTDFGHRVVAALDERGLPVAEVGAEFDLGVPIARENVRFERGCVFPDAEREAEALGSFSYSLSMRRHAAASVLTFETPLREAWEVRVHMHRIAVLAAISGLIPER